MQSRLAATAVEGFGNELPGRFIEDVQKFDTGKNIAARQGRA